MTIQSEHPVSIIKRDQEAQMTKAQREGRSPLPCSVCRKLEGSIMLRPMLPRLKRDGDTWTCEECIWERNR